MRVSNEEDSLQGDQSDRLGPILEGFEGVHALWWALRAAVGFKQGRWSWSFRTGSLLALSRMN